MEPELGELAVDIVRFVDDCQPGIVAGEFVDAEDRHHTIVDTVPMFGVDALLDANSRYPQPGAVRCTVLKRWSDAQGRELISISTAWPDVVESTEEDAEFVVLSTQVSPIPRGHRERNAQGWMIWVDDE
ncbi:MAG TPA: hypothetical protein VNV86_20550 [Candidatus Acidoferrum sp.]|nr:hypothetical protein [Candidatus Acidoferrum sp.]